MSLSKSMKTRHFKRLRVYRSFVKAGVMETLSFKWAIFGWLFVDSLSILLTCFLWYAIFNQTNDGLYQFNEFNERVLNGFTLPQMISYKLTAMIVSSLVYSSVSFWFVTDDIREGNIAMQLIRPISYRLRILSESIGSFIVNFFILFIPVMTLIVVINGSIFGFDKIFFSFNWYNIVFGLLSVSMSLLILDTIDFMFAQFSFFTGASFGLMLLKSAIIQFFSGALIPFSFYPSWAQVILNLLPFASTLSSPTLIIMGKYTLIGSLQVLGLQLFWCIVLCLLSTFIYSKSCKHVISVGG